MRARDTFRKGRHRRGPLNLGPRRRSTQECKEPGGEACRLQSMIRFLQLPLIPAPGFSTFLYSVERYFSLTSERSSS